jgi:hypothetical protein
VSDFASMWKEDKPNSTIGLYFKYVACWSQKPIWFLELISKIGFQKFLRHSFQQW